MKKTVLGILLVLLAVSVVVGQEQYLSANDLDGATLTSAIKSEGFTIYATDKKSVKIDAMDEGREAADGEVFTQRIKLNGSGSLEYRCISFSAKKDQKVTVYTNSSSKTDARTLNVANKAGDIVATITAPIDSDPAAPTLAGMGEFTVPSDGVYFIYSSGSGINIYQIIVE